MATQASWLDKTWKINADKICGLNDLSLSRELDVEENDSKDGKNPTNTKGYKPQNLTTTHTVGFAIGTNPRKELEAWQARCGQRAPFYVGGRRFGPAVLVLDKVEFNASALNNTGDILEAEITLSFSEDTEATAAPAAAIELYVNNSGVTISAPAYQPNASAATNSAYSIRPGASASLVKS